MECEDLYKVAEACICLTFYEDAAILYKKYIEECNAKDPAAWHGLANALEEIKDEAYKEAYKKLMNFMMKATGVPLSGKVGVL